MKTLIRLAAGYGIALPIVLLTRFSTLRHGREQAIKRWGPLVTKVGITGVLAFIGRIKRPEDFPLFQAQTLEKIAKWTMIYDAAVSRKDDNVLQFKITNCPFNEAFIKLGYPEFGPCLCQGDWEVARRNQGRWKFERTCQIGTGDAYCDHTYLRIE